MNASHCFATVFITFIFRFWQEWTCIQPSLTASSRSTTSKATRPSATLSELNASSLTVHPLKSFVALLRAKGLVVIDCAPESGGAEGSALASGRNEVLTSFGSCKYSLWKRTSISKYWTCMTFNLLVDKHLIIRTSSCAHLKEKHREQAGSLQR